MRSRSDEPDSGGLRMIRFSAAVSILGALAVTACSDETSVPVRSVEKQPTCENTVEALTSEDRGRVCKASVAKLMGRDPSIMSVHHLGGGITRVSYNRPDDGKRWVSDCRVEGDTVVWADVENGTRQRWRTHPMDEKIAYSMHDETIRICETFSDGSMSSEDVKVTE
jgi:hypothetical protein